MDEMTLERALELLKIERECVLRQNGGGCQREQAESRLDCWGCDLVQTDTEIIAMYNAVISLVSNYLDAQNSMREWAKVLGDNSAEVDSRPNNFDGVRYEDNCPCGRGE